MRFVHKNYGKIPFSYRRKTLDYLKKEGLNRPPEGWLITEKIHGESFTIYCNGKDLRYASKTGRLDKNELQTFFGADKIMDKLGYNFIKAAKTVKSNFKDAHAVVFYGQLYGGKYPGVKSVSNLEVKSGVYYSPSLELAIFDVGFISSNGSITFLGCNRREALLSDYNIPGVPLLASYDTLTEALGHPSGELTTIPNRKKLPPIKGNTMKGVILRPKAEILLPRGYRALLQKENDSFGKALLDTPIEVAEGDITLADELKDCIAMLNKHINLDRASEVILESLSQGPKDGWATVKKASAKTLQDFVHDNDESAHQSNPEKRTRTKKFAAAIASVIKPYIIP